MFSISVTFTKMYTNYCLTTGDDSKLQIFAFTARFTDAQLVAAITLFESVTNP